MTTERYTQPCAYAKGMMWLLGAGVPVALFLYTVITSRLEAVERRVATIEMRVAEIGTDVRWMREAMQRTAPRP